MSGKVFSKYIATESEMITLDRYPGSWLVHAEMIGSQRQGFEWQSLTNGDLFEITSRHGCYYHDTQTYLIVVAALAYAIAQIAACCVFFAIAEIAIAHGELGSIFRLVYISTSLSLVASIVTMAYYIKKSWFYKIAMGVNGLGFICCLAALAWVVFTWIAHTGQVLKSSTFLSYCALMIILLLQFAPSLMFEISLKLVSHDHDNKESYEKLKDSGSQTDFCLLKESYI
ncbi:hypothetical protein DdX_04239 [Ditylenchus destructor]|uniref:Uncharacterized protein n=1 Tax=Ditylenchus destructor TaxID=166010 RepID=A0AAD4NE68_9BILA|nr:hypothetical protein DdX_04239 [Ditylenchus destructor]